MARIKIKEIEGEAQDIQKLFQEQECDLSSYIGVGRKCPKISVFWIWGLVLAFYVLACCIWTNVFINYWSKVAIIGAFMLFFLLIGIIQYNFKNWTLTFITGIAGLAIILVSLGVYSPQEIAKKIEQATTKKLDEKAK